MATQHRLAVARTRRRPTTRDTRCKVTTQTTDSEGRQGAIANLGSAARTASGPPAAVDPRGRFAFAIDLAHCPNCGGELTLIAAVLEAGLLPWQPVIEMILTHRGLQARSPPRAPTLSIKIV